MVGRTCTLKDSISFLVYTLIRARYVYSKVKFENKMWYFTFKPSIPFLKPGKYGLALSRILHSSGTSMFLLFWPHKKLGSSVAFRLFSYLKEFLCLDSLIYYIVLWSYIYYIYTCFCRIWAVCVLWYIYLLYLKRRFLM